MIMRKIIPIAVEQIVPSPQMVLKQSMYGKQKLQSMVTRALKIWCNLAKATAIIQMITHTDFHILLKGMPFLQYPIAYVSTHSKKLALFVMTIDHGISEEISRQFLHGEYLLGYFLDHISSLSLDIGNILLQQEYGRILSNYLPAESRYIMAYSPGYCGWDLSAQKILFDIIQPQEINLHLTPNYLMVPIKSISGVLVAGEKNIHCWTEHYPCCDTCTTFNCRERMKSVQSW